LNIRFYKQKYNYLNKKEEFSEKSLNNKIKDNENNLEFKK